MRSLWRFDLMRRLDHRAGGGSNQALKPSRIAEFPKIHRTCDPRHSARRMRQYCGFDATMTRQKTGIVRGLADSGRR
jgi:hypothetical protein